MRHLLDTTDLSLDEIDDIISLATDIISNPKKYAHVCDGKKLATLFFEPSTRTRLSFEAEMLSVFPRRRQLLRQRAKQLRTQ